MKSIDKVIEVQTEFAKSAYETFVAETQKIAGLYTDLAKQTFKPLESVAAKFVPAAAAYSVLFRKAKSPAVRPGFFCFRIVLLSRSAGDAELAEQRSSDRSEGGGDLV